MVYEPWYVPETSTDLMPVRVETSVAGPSPSEPGATRGMIWFAIGSPGSSCEALVRGHPADAVVLGALEGARGGVVRGPPGRVEVVDAEHAVDGRVALAGHLQERVHDGVVDGEVAPRAVGLEE